MDDREPVDPEDVRGVFVAVLVVFAVAIAGGLIVWMLP